MVKLAAVEQQALTITSTATGTLQAKRAIQVFNQQEGQIVELPYYEGDTVQASDVLVRLDDSVLKAELNKATATRRQAETDLHRLEKLIPKKLASAEQVARARTAVQVARAEEQLKRTLLSHTVIKAAFAGVISERLREPGDIAKLHTHILSLIDPSSLRAEIRVSELLLTSIKQGDALDVRIDALGANTYTGRVLRVFPTIDPQTRQGIVEVELDPVPPGARAGQLCRVNFATQTVTGLAIPQAALQREGDQTYVFQVDDKSKIKRKTLRIGLRAGELVQVLEGLDAGERVIVSGLLGLRVGKKVQVIDPQSTAKDTGITKHSKKNK